MLDKTELQKLIEAPIGQKCLITDPFPTSKTKQFQVVMKPGIASDGLSAISYGFAGAGNCKKDSTGQKTVLVTIHVIGTVLDFTNREAFDELGATICHEFGHAQQYILGTEKRLKVDHPHAYALIAPDEGKADIHALYCGYGKILANRFRRIWNALKDDEMFCAHNADLPMRAHSLEYFIKKYAVTQEEQIRRIDKYHINCRDRTLYYTLACSNGNFTRVYWKIKSITFGEEDIVTIDLFGRIGANRIWDDHEHLVVFQNECEFV